MARILSVLAAANLDTNGAELAGFDANDTGALISGGTFFNGDDTENLLVSLDNGSTYPVVIGPGLHWNLPAGGPFKIGGAAANGLKWKASANTISACSFVYASYVAAAAVADP